MTFALPDELDFAQGAALILNYHTAYFALKLRGRLEEGERVLVHGAAGGVGTAALQVAKGPGREHGRGRLERGEGAASPARRAPTKSFAPTVPGASRSQGAPAAASTSCSIPSAATGSPTACGRCVRTAGVVVVGFTGGSIPEVKVNRLLLRNTEVVGAGWGAYAMARPDAQP